MVMAFSQLLKVLVALIGCCVALTHARYMLHSELSMGGVRGAVMFNQGSKADTLNIIVQLKPVEAADWAIHTYPTVYNRDSISSCSELGPIIPFGNLTEKHDRFGYRSTYSNIDLKAYGTNSILGRSVVFYYPNGTIRACSTILPFNSAVAYATAVFRGPVGGKVHLMQQEEVDAATLVWGELYHTDGVTSVSGNHDWYVSEEAVSGFGQCSHAQTVFGVVELANHTCSPNEPTACRTGDLTGKLGKRAVGVAGNSASRRRFRFVTFGLPLSGNMSVLQHGLVLTKATVNEPKACAAILKAGPLAVEAFFEATANIGISGGISFKQMTPFHSTSMTIMLDNLSNRIGGYHIHSFPIPYPVPSEACSGASVGGHYNPYSVDAKSPNYPETGNGTFDEFEVGDLSGKFGSLSGLNSIDDNFTDPSLTLFGSGSFLGRSIVLHKDDNTTARLTCLNLYPSGAGKLTGKADFGISSELTGAVVLEQYYQNNDVITDTTITIDLSYKQSPTNMTMQHNWHVHVEPVGIDYADPIATRCVSVGPHYNPYNVSTIKPSYSSECSSIAPYRCELGDINGKHARHNIGGGKKYYVEENLPLYGAETVLGRSMTLHAENAGMPRLACADLVPQQGDSIYKLNYEVKKSGATSKVHFQRNISSALSISEWQVSYPIFQTHGSNSQCYAVSFYLIDGRRSPNINQLKSTFDNLVASNSARIGSLEPCPSSPSSALFGSTASPRLVLVAVSFVAIISTRLGVFS